VVDGYTLVLAGFLLPAGALGDRIGAKRVFQAGMAIFAVASADSGWPRTSSCWSWPAWSR
jgi:MFS family permease